MPRPASPRSCWHAGEGRPRDAPGADRGACGAIPRPEDEPAVAVSRVTSAESAVRPRARAPLRPPPRTGVSRDPDPLPRLATGTRTPGPRSRRTDSRYGEVIGTRTAVARASATVPAL